VLVSTCDCRQSVTESYVCPTMCCLTVFSCGSDNSIKSGHSCFDTVDLTSGMTHSLSILTAILPNEPGIADFIGAKDDASGGGNVQSSSQSLPPTNQHRAFYSLDALLVIQPTVSKHISNDNATMKTALLLVLKDLTRQLFEGPV